MSDYALNPAWGHLIEAESVPDEAVEKMEWYDALPLDIDVSHDIDADDRCVTTMKLLLAFGDEASLRTFYADVFGIGHPEDSRTPDSFRPPRHPRDGLGAYADMGLQKVVPSIKSPPDTHVEYGIHPRSRPELRLQFESERSGVSGFPEGFETFMQRFAAGDFPLCDERFAAGDVPLRADPVAEGDDAPSALAENPDANGDGDHVTELVDVRPGDVVTVADDGAGSIESIECDIATEDGETEVTGIATNLSYEGSFSIDVEDYEEYADLARLFGVHPDDEEMTVGLDDEALSRLSGENLDYLIMANDVTLGNVGEDADDGTTSDDGTNADDGTIHGVPECPTCETNDVVQLSTGEWVCQSDHADPVFEVTDE